MGTAYHLVCGVASPNNDGAVELASDWTVVSPAAWGNPAHNDEWERVGGDKWEQRSRES
jgi:hypothetical protein